MYYINSGLSNGPSSDFFRNMEVTILTPEGIKVALPNKDGIIELSEELVAIGYYDTKSCGYFNPQAEFCESDVQRIFLPIEMTTLKEGEYFPEKFYDVLCNGDLPYSYNQPAIYVEDVKKYSPLRMEKRIYPIPFDGDMKRLYNHIIQIKNGGYCKCDMVETFWDGSLEKMMTINVGKLNSLYEEEYKRYCACDLWRFSDHCYDMNKNGYSMYSFEYGEKEGYRKVCHAQNDLVELFQVKEHSK